MEEIKEKEDWKKPELIILNFKETSGGNIPADYEDDYHTNYQIS